ncbi:hypothetical protein NX059_008312 [Plenodomus lindquistii]|nr:hypothetical protein NX059_008312 [Plenodomus lindquistii]
MAKNIFQLISRQQPKTFKISYTPEYKTFILHHIATDPSHPLHIAQKRRQAERRKEGLWWHVTTGLDLTKSSCVRTWARRRLRQAVRHELAARGYDEKGSLVNAAAVVNRPDLLAVLRQGRSLDLKGSLRLHVLAPLIPAKFTTLCEETGQLLDNMLQVLKAGAADPSMRKIKPASPQREGFPVRAKQPRDKESMVMRSKTAKKFQFIT